ncbi:chloramphenicol acetyltransferase [Dysgonomonas sp. Marseille-P4677]|uniref:chloramphenicol acetyltransferase n=1 Tax=Dysgonomonas sp. Marseille-P4677 TaxID=2364790 RepID=UPI001912CAF2|nr:chloramphenicol acetyltransferase [Dysgonomonas sp. Marseille-P4677]MBK5721287.1 chloramphenicol acetyltransferase [Dysgonomonas sp. Marseille-P4677]
MKKKIIDIENWKRKEHFNFFKTFDDPFFGITVNVDFSTIYYQAKEEGTSFFLYSLHKIMQAVNAVEAFRYRIEDDKLVCYDIIHPAPTVGREDGTFSFSFFEYYPDIRTFVDNTRQIVEKVKTTTGLGLDASPGRNDVIHYSSVPWIQFTDMKHAVSFGNNAAIPKISTGKYFSEEQKIMLPVSITANHAVMDGLHISLFLDKLHEYIESE